MAELESGPARSRRRGVRFLLVAAFLTAFVVVGLDQPAQAEPTVGSPKVLRSKQAGLRAPRVASSGTNLLVVWLEQDKVMASRVGVEDSPTALEPVQIASGADPMGRIDVAFNGTKFLVVWGTGAFDIRGRLLGTDTDLAAGTNVTVDASAGAQFNPSVTVGGSTFFVVWNDLASGSAQPNIYGRRISGAGAPLGTARTPIATTGKGELHPDVAWNGTSYLVAYQLAFSVTDDDVVGRRVSSGGSVVGELVSISRGSQLETEPAVASNGTEWFVVWTNGSGLSGDIFGTPVSSTGVVSQAGARVGPEAGEQHFPEVAFNGTYLVMWQREDEANQTDVQGARVTDAGQVVDEAGFTISGNPARAEITPAIAPMPGTDRWAVEIATIQGSAQTIQHRVVTSPK